MLFAENKLEKVVIPEHFWLSSKPTLKLSNTNPTTSNRN